MEETAEKQEKQEFDPTKASKKCSKCGEIKTLDQFNKRRASLDGYTYKCKHCEVKQVQKNFAERKESGAVKQYYEENREDILSKGKKYYMEHREHLLTLNKKYRTEHPEVHDRSTQKRKAQIASQKGKPYNRAMIVQRDSEIVEGKLTPICQICHLPIFNIKDLQIDHTIPIGKGGLDCYDNVRTCHRLCNIQRPLDGRDVT